MPDGSVVVVGSVNMDVIAKTPRHPAVGETVLGTDLAFAPGGKGGNQAVAAARILGSGTGAAGRPAVRMVGRVGADAFGSTLRTFLAEEGVDVERLVVDDGAPTGTALIVVGADGDNTIVVVPGANALVSLADVSACPISAGDVVVAQYEIPIDVVEAAFARAKAAGATTVLNPAPARETPASLLALADVVVVNETELALLAGADGEPADLAPRLRQRADQVVIATLGARGAVVAAAGGVDAIPGVRVTAVDTTGAGDCFVGVLAARLLTTDVRAAVGYATVAASISVQRDGAAPSMPTAAEVDAAVAAGPPVQSAP